MSTVSPDWEISPELALAYLQASIVRADVGAIAARLRLYTTTRPATILDAHTDTPQAVITLKKPCGIITSGTLVLLPADAGGAMVQHNGMPRWGDWVTGDGAVLAHCDVTDMDHEGGIRVVGGGTPVGETSPMLYAGGLVQLGLVAFT